MPLPMVHLSVAQKFAENIDIKNHALFYIGALAPDAIHMRENHSREKKRITHLDYDSKKALNFIEENKQSKNYSFYLGYAVHLLTDNYWIESLYDTFDIRYDEDSEPEQDRTSAYYNDMNLLDLALYNKQPNRKSIFELLESTNAISAKFLLSATEIEDWKQYVMGWYNKIETKYRYPVKYLNINEIEGFVESTSSNLKDILKL